MQTTEEIKSEIEEKFKNAISLLRETLDLTQDLSDISGDYLSTSKLQDVIDDLSSFELKEYGWNQSMYC